MHGMAAVPTGPRAVFKARTIVVVGELVALLRTELSDALKQAIDTRDACAVRVIRLILAAIRDRELSARSNGGEVPITDKEILALLQTMVDQREEAIPINEANGRSDLALTERGEVSVIRSFLPAPMDTGEIDRAISEAISECRAHGMKDMSRIMALLKQRYPGRMDFAAAGTRVRRTLIG